MVILNNSPVLSLSEIIIKIFNNEFLSDCVFTFESEEHILYAHSFLLRARSIVFEKQFESICDQDKLKMISITDYSYEIFSQFMRFIYTDDCTITKENVIALLELALKYKIPKLENMVNRFIIDQNLEASENLRIYEFCVTKPYQLLHNWIADLIGSQLADVIKSDLFLEIESDTLEEILKMDTVGTHFKPVEEIDIFKALLRWLERYSVKNNANFDERRCKFDQLKGAIRFPVMMIAELKDILSQHENLLTNLDLVSFFASTANDGQVWNCTKRNVYRLILNRTFGESEKSPIKETSNVNLPVIKDAPVKKITEKVLWEERLKPSSSVNLSNWFPASKDEPIKKTSVEVHTFSNSKMNFANPFPSGAENFNFKLQNPVRLANRNLATFTPDKDLMITGIWLKISLTKLATIIVKCDDAEILKLPVNAPSYETILSLGESMRLEADKQYKILIEGEMNFKGSAFNKSVLNPRDVIKTDIAKCLRNVEVSKTVAQIFFGIPTC